MGNGTVLPQRAAPSPSVVRRAHRARDSSPDPTQQKPPVPGPSVKPSIDYLDRTIIDYRDHSQCPRRLLDRRIGLQPGLGNGDLSSGQPIGQVRRPCHNLVVGCEDSRKLFPAHSLAPRCPTLLASCRLLRLRQSLPTPLQPRCGKILSRHS